MLSLAPSLYHTHEERIWHQFSILVSASSVIINFVYWDFVQACIDDGAQDQENASISWIGFLTQAGTRLSICMTTSTWGRGVNNYYARCSACTSMKVCRRGGGQREREGRREGIPSKKMPAHRRFESGSMHAVMMNAITKLRNNRLCYSYLPLLNCNHASSITLSTAKLSIFSILWYKNCIESVFYTSSIRVLHGELSAH